MKGFFRSKIFLTITALVLLAGAIAIPLSSSIIPSHAQAAPTVTLNPTQAPAGANVKATGNNWIAGDTISVRFDGTTLTTFTPVRTNWTRTIIIPNSATVGQHGIVFEDPKKITVELPFTVTSPTTSPSSLATVCTQTGQHSIACNGPLWAGYVREGSLSLPIRYELVTGSWKQPSVDCQRTPDSNSLVWVGMGGLKTPLVQIGTVAKCNGTTPSLSAFWETVFGTSNIVDVFRSRQHSINQIVSPGDDMTAEVSSTGNGKYDLILSDKTAGWTFDTGVISGPTDDTTRETADCIVERPPNPIIHLLSPLADFNKVDFSCGASGVVVSGKHKGEVVAGGPVVIKFVITQNGNTLAHPLPATITPARLIFSVHWDDSGTPESI